MAKTAEITLGERAYTLKEKPMGMAAIWREQLRKSRAMLIFESLDTAMIQLVAVADQATEVGEDGNAKGFANIDLNQVVGIAKILPVIVNGLANSVDEINSMLFAYSPELQADREWIEENAYDTEAIAAFCEVLSLCFPIMGVLALVRGPQAAQTPMKSRSQNGTSGRQASAHRQRA